MADVLSRRNAVLGWMVWNLAKRRLRKKLHAGGDPPRRRKALRAIVAVVALAAVAAALAKRCAGGDEPAE